LGRATKTRGLPVWRVKSRIVVRMSAPSSGARYPGSPVPHVAISREERDLPHAGYEVHLLELTPMGMHATRLPRISSRRAKARSAFNPGYGVALLTNAT